MRDNPIHSDSLPLEVQQLVEVMLGIDPSWNLEQWLKEQATQSLELIASELEVERVTAEQRLKRIDNLKNRLKDDNIEQKDANQLNLFDCFELDVDKTMIGLGSRAINSQNDEEFIDKHPANAFLDLLPTDRGDDPLLAVACQNLLMIIESASGKSNNMVSLETIVSKMDEMGIDFAEIDEAIEHLLMMGSIIEIDDDYFILS